MLLSRSGWTAAEASRFLDGVEATPLFYRYLEFGLRLEPAEATQPAQMHAAHSAQSAEAATVHCAVTTDTAHSAHVCGLGHAARRDEPPRCDRAPGVFRGRLRFRI